MPNGDTFSIPPIYSFVSRYLSRSKVSVDPFARNSTLAAYRNDLDPETKAPYHMDAIDFLKKLLVDGVKADLLIIDPPYSLRQVSELYTKLGKTMTMEDGQTGAYFKELKDLSLKLLTEDAVVLGFGWNTIGMGKERGFEIVEIMLVCHGGSGHNDTICMAEKRSDHMLERFNRRATRKA